MRWSNEHGMVVRRTGADASASRPELVWIHGLGESSVSFEPVVADARLAGHAHVLCDLPGYGRSAWPETPSGLEALAGALAAWLEGRPPAVLLGHSMGGVLATLVAERIPVRGVVDIDGNLSRGDCTFSAEAAAWSEAAFETTGLAELRAKVYADGVTQAPLRGYHAAMCLASPRVFYRHAQDLVRLSEAETLAPRLAALAAPYLFVAGVPGGICVRSRELLAAHGVRSVALEPAGHWVYLDARERFVGEVERFVAAL